MPAEPHHQRRNQSQNRRGAGEKHAGHGQRLHHVLQQALDADGEDSGLALFGVIALDHAHAAQRLGQPASDLGVDLAPLAEDGANHFEPILQNKHKRAHHGEDGKGDATLRCIR